MSSSLLVCPFLALAMVGCQSGRRPLVAIDALQIPKKIAVTSKTFKSGGWIPLTNSTYGKSISPDLEWSAVPAKTESVLLLVQDPDTAHGLFTHWLLYDISPKMRSLPPGIPARRGIVPQGIQGLNDAGGIGYFGPQPPDAPAHHYHFQIFACNARIRPRPGDDTSLIYAFIHDHAIAGGDLIGLFKKP